MLDFLLKIGKKDRQVRQLNSELSLAGHYSARIIPEARAYLISLLNYTKKQPLVILAINDEQARSIANEISQLTFAYHLPQPQERESFQSQSKRILALDKLNKPQSIVCLSIEAFLNKTVVPKKLVKRINLKTSQKTKLTTLAKKLVSLGYSREYQVNSPAQFSIRGNICDIYPVLSKFPVRLDFFGDLIETMHFFNPLDQISMNSINQVSIEPCQLISRGISNIKDFINDKSIIITLNKSLIKNKLKENKYSFVNQQTTLDLTLLTNKSYANNFDFEKIPFEAGQFEKFFSFLKKMQNQGFLITLNIEERGKRERLKEMLHQQGLVSEGLRKNLAIIQPLILLTNQKHENSFVWPAQKIAVISDKDIFIRQLQRFEPALNSSHTRISSLEDIKIDDFLVHVNHGIARYKGLETKTIGDIKREYIKLSYAQKDKLYVPVTEMDRISRYVGADDKEPCVSKLNSSKWALTKKKVKKSVRKLAIDLLNLYSKRNQVSGFSFSPDSPWQKQLEDDFPFTETKGQLSAIEEVKEDMQNQKPMDRLICGDVGYGKTEVALRASFKAVQDEKQVLLLVPTTILAQQHFNTFNSRLNPYPVIIKMLSRFVPKNKQKQIVSDFNEGKVDILIGTHRLLQKDIKPKDLGLLIVDEEQRFGVSHKEKLKSLKTNVDVITLSATPIPRTLQMALSGIRDLSVIETPPDNRHPVLTHVGQYDIKLVVDAINKELTRGGQVFYLYNQVQYIENAARKIASLIPQAKIGIAHGQLKEHQLEKTMLAFLKGEINVLVTTTIIESGIDISKANTLIVDNAERFGLSQLYQIRGRVGRSATQAYAYLFYRRHLTDNAIERLKTLADLTALGSGYKIALRDLEIRGAGNLLGAEQSGQIAAVGFDLYIQLLQKTIDELRGSAPKKKQEPKDLKISAFIPNFYISDSAIRIDFYQRLASAKNKNDLNAIIEELNERFGHPPKEVQNLHKIALLKFNKV